MAVIVPGSIIEPMSVSDDFTVTGIGVSEERMRLAHSEQLSEILGGEHKSVIFMPTEEERQLVNQLFVIMWNLVNGTMVRNATIDQMLGVITHAFNDVFCNQSTLDKGGVLPILALASMNCSKISSISLTTIAEANANLISMPTNSVLPGAISALLCVRSVVSRQRNG